MASSQIRLRAPAGELSDDPRREDELLLRRHVLDAQIVDVVGKRLTRVEVVLLERDASRLRVVGVKVGKVRHSGGLVSSGSPSGSRPASSPGTPCT